MGQAQRVLVIEDHDSVRTLVQLLLEDEDDLEVVGTSNSGRDLVPMADELRPDVVILDLGLPDLDGEDALAALKDQHPEIRVVVLSGQASALSWPRLSEHGAASIVEKGVGQWEDALLGALRRRDD